MIIENANCETLEQREELVASANVKDGNPSGVRLEASEFQRLLERAAEVLSLRGRMAA